MLKFVLIDDCEEELDSLEKLLNRYLNSNGLEYELCRFSSPDSFLKSLTFQEAGIKDGIYLLDVMMPGMDGIELGKEIRRKDESARIIFISSSPDYALKSFEARAFYYLLKPVWGKQFFEVMDLVMKEHDSAAQSKINIRTKSGEERVLKSDILYVELKERRSLYVLSQKTIQSNYLTQSFTAANENLLLDPRFFACGASLIVNLSYIREIEKDGRITIGAKDGEKYIIHIPLRTVPKLISVWMAYCLEEKN